MLIDLTAKEITGKSAENRLESAGIILNRNVVPGDAENPGKISGIRIGSGAVSARGMAKSQMYQIVELMDVTMVNQPQKEVLQKVKEEVLSLCKSFPVNR